MEVNLKDIYVDQITGDFFIPSYQRGYRWTKAEVIRLLEDVYGIILNKIENEKNNNNNKSTQYCLQPIVVKRTENGIDVIDGQQRLTTLYLIYKYISNNFGKLGESKFTLEYEFNTGKANFLKNVDLTLKEENIDYYFMASSYETIEEWFGEHDEMLPYEFIRVFKNNVKVIWYEVGEEEDAIALFERLNIGKIPLTSAELIKAMFLSDSSGGVMPTERQNEISLQWDSIERELHKEDFWYFLSNKKGETYSTRIDLILDIIAGKVEGERDKYFTFFAFEKMRKTTDLKNVWKLINRTFLTLKDWFEDHTYYHKIGYLIASEEKTLSEIFEISKGKTKTEFKDELNDVIKKGISGIEYGDLSYENSKDKATISKILLLFNVETVCSDSSEVMWFPFDKFKYNNNNKVVWSLEHIHAQQSKGMKTVKEWRKWLELHIKSLKGMGEEYSEIVEEMQEAYDLENNLKGELFRTIQEKVFALLSEGGGADYEHSLSNMALLNAGDNAALNNSTFDVKRNIIVEMDRGGHYIPLCTKKVFLKYYTESEDNQIHFWGEADRKAYIAEMNRVLKPYLENEIVIGKEQI